MKKFMQYFTISLVLVFMSWLIFTNENDLFTGSGKSDFEVQVYERLVNHDNIQEAHLEMNITAGKISLNAESTSLLEANVRYFDEEGKPEYSEQISSNNIVRMNLSENRQNSSVNLTNRRNTPEWNVMVRPDVISNFDIAVGAGDIDIDLSATQVSTFNLSTGAAQANVNLSNSLVSELEIKTGIGAVTLDVSGNRINDLTAKVQGGLGALTLIVPEDVGVRVSATGLGHVSARGFNRERGSYKNDLWGKSDYSIDVSVSAGIGSVTVLSK